MKKTKIMLLAMLSIGMLSSCVQEPDAIFSVTSEEFETDEVIEFTNESMNAEAYVWDFGDGTTTNQINPTHSYKYTGDYTISLSAVSKDMESNTTKTITIVPGFTPTIYEGESVDDIYIYDTWSYIRGVCGVDTTYSLSVIDDVEPVYMHSVYYEERGLEFIFLSYDSILVEEDNMYWVYVDVKNGGITYKGIDFESSIEDLYDAYDTPENTKDYEYPSYYYTVYFYEALGVEFFQFNGSGFMDLLVLFEPVDDTKSAIIDKIEIQNLARNYIPMRSKR